MASKKRTVKNLLERPCVDCHREFASRQGLAVHRGVKHAASKPATSPDDRSEFIKGMKEDLLVDVDGRTWHCQYGDQERSGSEELGQMVSPTFNEMPPESQTHYVQVKSGRDLHQAIRTALGDEGYATYLKSTIIGAIAAGMIDDAEVGIKLLKEVA